MWRTPIAVAALAVAACRNDCAPVVKGGTTEERTRVADAVSVFRDRLVPELDMCVPSVRIVDDLPEHSGDYTPITRRCAWTR